jgi:hypothetical protein
MLFEGASMRAIVTLLFLAALVLPIAAFGGNWKDAGGTDLTRPTGTVANPSTSPIIRPGYLAYFTYAASGTTPPPLNIQACQSVLLKFHPDYGGNGSYDAEIKVWDCHTGAPTLDASVASFTEEYYCDRILIQLNGKDPVLDDITLNGDDGTDPDADLVFQQRAKIDDIRGAFLHIEHTTDPSGSDVSRTTVVCSPQTN